MAVVVPEFAALLAVPPNPGDPLTGQVRSSAQRRSGPAGGRVAATTADDVPRRRALGGAHSVRVRRHAPRRGAGRAHWSTQLLAEQLGVSFATVAWIWRKWKLQLIALGGGTGREEGYDCPSSQPAHSSAFRRIANPHRRQHPVPRCGVLLGGRCRLAKRVSHGATQTCGEPTTPGPGHRDQAAPRTPADGRDGCFLPQAGPGCSIWRRWSGPTMMLPAR